MARIEISLEEYNALKDKIQQLENSIADLSEKITLKNKKIEELLENISNLKEKTSNSFKCIFKKLSKKS